MHSSNSLEFWNPGRSAVEVPSSRRVGLVAMTLHVLKDAGSIPGHAAIFRRERNAKTRGV